MNDLTQREQDLVAAAYLWGVMAACHEVNRYPKHVDRQELHRHAIIAHQILTGGGFNPLQVWNALDFARKLSQELADRCNDRQLAAGRR